MLAEGAEAKIYAIDFLGLDCILKKRIVKDYRIKEIDENLRTYRTRNEARIIGTVSSLGINSPEVLLVGKYELVMKRVYGKMLNEILNSKKKKSNLKEIFRKLGNYLAILHKNNIVHGDFTPANVMIGKNGTVYLIDFGLSDVTDSLEDKALDLLLMKRAIDENYDEFIEAYKSKSDKNDMIIKRLNEIEKRGRYNSRTLAIN